MNRAIGGVLFGLGMLALSAPASAFVSYLYQGAADCSGSGSSRHCTNGGVDVTATAHAFTANSNGGTNNTLASATLGVYTGGLGVTHGDSESTSQPQHTLDNDGRYEMIMLTFTTAVRLTEVWTRWMQGDADLTILAHTGAGTVDATTPITSNPNTLTASGLISIANGWELVGGNHVNGPDIGSGTTSTALKKIALGTPADVKSQHWLIGAYNGTNPGFGGNASGADHGSGQYDYLKVYAAGGDIPTKAPEPGSLSLLALALAGLWRFQRRRARA